MANPASSSKQRSSNPAAPFFERLQIGALSGDEFGLLFVPQAAPGPLVGQPIAPQQATPLLDRAADAKYLLHLFCDLGGAPDALVGLRPSADLGENVRRDGRGLADMGPVIKTVEAAREVSLDPSTDRLFMEAQMAGDLGDAPAGAREADHLDPVACAGGQSALVSVPLELLVCGLI